MPETIQDGKGKGCYNGRQEAERKKEETMQEGKRKGSYTSRDELGRQTGGRMSETIYRRGEEVKKK